MPQPFLRGRRQKVLLLQLVFLLTAALAGRAQSGAINYNTYYRYPFSVGVEYQSLSPFAYYGAQYNIFDLAGILRWPIPSIPVLQPTLKAGMIKFDSRDADDPDKWDHNHWYGELGLAYAHRFAKSFELTAEIGAGITEAVFRNLIPEEGTVGSMNLLLEAGVRICLDPSYNLSIDVHPNLKYLYSFSPLKDFNGLIFSIGFASHYRFGQDPDSPRSIIRSIKFDELVYPDLYAAMQSFYVQNSVGSITITNTERYSITDIEVSFFQPGYMDSPTPAISIIEMEPGAQKKIDIFASFNEEVFRTEGITPLTGEVIVTYKSKGRPAEQRQSVSYDLYDKTAIIWDDDRKVAAFVTPADSALRNYASFIRQVCKEEVIPTFNEPLQYGMQVFHALGEKGCLYQADPALPFTKVQDNPVIVDSISLPRDTLKRITGDCDDLTVLYCSLLETAGIESGFITVPGHIYPAFNTKVPTQQYKSVHVNRAMMINVDGEIWIPVEITLVGKANFLESWRRGVDEWSVYDTSPEKRSLYSTRKAQSLYRPVGLKETDLGIQYGRKEEIVKNFNSDLDRLVEQVIADYITAARNSNSKADYNRLGIAFAQFQRYDQAKEAFSRALNIDPDYMSARVNLGSILFLKQDYSGALRYLLEVYKELQIKGEQRPATTVKILLNISKTYYQMGEYARAQEYYQQAASIDPGSAERYSHLGERASGEGRAAVEMVSALDILFLEEVEE